MKRHYLPSKTILNTTKLGLKFSRSFSSEVMSVKEWELELKRYKVKNASIGCKRVKLIGEW